MRNITSSIAGLLIAALLAASFGVGSAEARSRHHNRGNAAAAAAAIALFGTIATLAAHDAYRDRYYGGSYYYGPPRGYYPRYRHRRWHRHYHHW